MPHTPALTIPLAYQGRKDQQPYYSQPSSTQLHPASILLLYQIKVIIIIILAWFPYSW